jgi:hypothetical protein
VKLGRASALLGAAATIAAGATGAAGAAAPIAHCKTAQLALKLVDVQGATSHRYLDFSLRNNGAASCSLKGYPGATLLDKHHKAINVTVHHATGFPVKKVILKPGKRAYFTFSYVVSGPCLPYHFSAYGVRFRPPGGSGGLVYSSGRLDICAPSVGGHPVVYPVRAKLALP